MKTYTRKLTKVSSHSYVVNIPKTFSQEVQVERKTKTCTNRQRPGTHRNPRLAHSRARQAEKIVSSFTKEASDVVWFQAVSITAAIFKANPKGYRTTTSTKVVAFLLRGFFLCCLCCLIWCWRIRSQNNCSNFRHSILLCRIFFTASAHSARGKL